MTSPQLSYRVVQTLGPPITYYTHQLLDSTLTVLHSEFSFAFNLEDSREQIKALVTTWVNEQPSENREYMVHLPTVEVDLNVPEDLEISYGSARNVIYFYD